MESSGRQAQARSPQGVQGGEAPRGNRLKLVVLFVQYIPFLFDSKVLFFLIRDFFLQKIFHVNLCIFLFLFVICLFCVQYFRFRLYTYCNSFEARKLSRIKQGRIQKQDEM